MYRLPDALRPALAAPFGPVHDTAGALAAARGRTVVAVGDVVTQTFLDHGVVPKVMVVDGVTQRGTHVEGALRNVPPHAARVVVENPAATITRRLHSALEAALAGEGVTVIEVVGEEDLAALPAIALAPEGWLVCYGQPHRGVVVVEATPQARDRAIGLLHQMET